MTTAAEIVERDTTAAEADPEPEPTEPEPVPEPEDDDDPQAVSPALSERQIEARMRAMDRESDRHKTNVAKIMGDDFAGWLECPLCPVPGYVPMPDGSPVDPLQRAAVLTAMGEEPEPELRTDPNKVVCEVCDGWGEVLTGGKTPTNAKGLCPGCQGAGAKPANLPPPHVQPPTALSPVAPPAPSGIVPMPEGPPPIPGAMWDYERGNWTLPPSIPS